MIICFCLADYEVVDDGWKVIGDIYRVSLIGFERLLTYEGYPGLYGYEVVKAHSSDDDSTMDVVIFTTSHAARFGAPSLSGDYFRKESECAETSRS